MCNSPSDLGTKPLNDTSDENLLEASLGQPETFELIIQRYERRVFGLLIRLCGSRPDAEDLYQDVWAKAFVGRASFSGRSRFSTWLYAITLNTVREWRRKMGRRKEDSSEFLPEPKAQGFVGVLDKLLGREKQQGLERAISRLQADDRELIALGYLEENDYEALSAAMQMPKARIRVRMFRALARLRAILQEDGYDAA